MEQQRVAVGRCLRDLIGAERAAGAADVLDHARSAPWSSVMRCANSRASMSVVAPAGNGTMMRMVLVGDQRLRECAGIADARPSAAERRGARQHPRGAFSFDRHCGPTSWSAA